MTGNTFYPLWWALLADFEIMRWGVWQPDQVEAQRRAVLQGVTRGLQDREDLTLERAGGSLAGTLSKCACSERYLRREVPGAARLWRALGRGRPARYP